MQKPSNSDPVTSILPKTFWWGTVILAVLAAIVVAVAVGDLMTGIVAGVGLVVAAIGYSATN